MIVVMLKAGEHPPADVLLLGSVLSFPNFFVFNYLLLKFTKFLTISMHGSQVSQRKSGKRVHRVGTAGVLGWF